MVACLAGILHGRWTALKFLDVLPGHSAGCEVAIPRYIVCMCVHGKTEHLFLQLYYIYIIIIIIIYIYICTYNNFNNNNAMGKHCRTFPDILSKEKTINMNQLHSFPQIFRPTPGSVSHVLSMNEAVASWRWPMRISWWYELGKIGKSGWNDGLIFFGSRFLQDHCIDHCIRWEFLPKK